MHYPYAIQEIPLISFFSKNILQSIVCYYVKVFNVASLRALAPSLTRITIAGAVGAAMHIGQGDKILVDAKAVEFSRAVFNQTEVNGEVISCEGPYVFLNRD